VSRFKRVGAKKEVAIVLVSGGIDSCVASAWASQSYELAILHVSYGQRTQQRELQASRDIADFFEARMTLESDLPHLKQIGGTSLIDPLLELPQGEPESIGVPTTYVPFRNAQLLAVAVSWAEVVGAAKVIIGVTYEDGAHYPDTTKEFLERFNKVVEAGTKPQTHIEIVAPLINLRKSEVIRLGQELGAPLHLTWSCYRNTIKACGTCLSCVRRLQAFEQAGIKDHIEPE
jgi:7-cyano-7-deazaguanine synthase